MRFISFVLLVFLAVLSACAAPAERHFSYMPPETPGGRLCVNQCSQANTYCHESCDLNSRQCVMKVQTQAMQDYDQYTREQFQAGAPIEFHPHDFERMTPCADGKKECMENCESQFTSCYKTCGGKVDATTSCQFMCF
jgi:hypothetical protein